MYLTDLIGGKPETDLERAVDRFFLGRSVSNVTSSFFDPDKRKRQLEEKVLESYLTDDSLTSKLRSGVSVAAWLSKPAKTGLAKLLER